MANTARAHCVTRNVLGRRISGHHAAREWRGGPGGRGGRSGPGGRGTENAKRGTVVVRSEGSEGSETAKPTRPPRPPPPPRRTPQQNQRNKDRPPSRLPKNGFFSDADPNATLYPVKSSLKQDPTKRSGNRYDSDFVWNSNWKDALDYNDTLVEREREKKSERARSGRVGEVGEVSEAEAEAEVGRISLVQTRQDLNSMDVDLTAQLLRGTAKDPAGAGNEKGRQSAPKIPTIQVVKRQQAQGDTTAQRKTQRETRAWSRSARYGSKPIAAPNNTPEQAEQELEDLMAYDKLKTELYLWTIGLTAVCMGAAVTFYSRDVAASYGVGALAGFLYLRSLSRQVDSFGSGFGGAGSPRLLIPLVLAAGFNRYNTLIAEDTGLYLSLLPMLVGFFTYKVALVGKQGLDLADDIFEREREQS